MLLRSFFRPRVLLYAFAVSLLMLAARTLLSNPPESSWVRGSSRIWPRPGGLDVTGSWTPSDDKLAEGQSTTDSAQPETPEPEKHEQQQSHSEDSQTIIPESTIDDTSGQKRIGLDREADAELPCRKLPGAENVVVIMRTGATEIQDKLPAHFETTFRCYSDLLIFSDYEEIFMGEQVHDVLKDMDPNFVEKNEDFEIYRRVKAGGREALRPEELSGKLSYEGSKSGKSDSPGWRLDKYKFLPMMRQTLNLRPDKQWYVFVESDTYVVWSNLLKYLEVLDPSKDVYYGSEVQIGDDLFAHGGSAFIMSRSAIDKGARRYEETIQDWNDITYDHWAGDCVLGIMLLQWGVELGWGWPLFQGGHPEKMDYAEEKGEVRIWCSPMVSFHHFNDVELHRIWQFEQDWISVILALENEDNGISNDGNDNVNANQRRWSLWNDHPRDDKVLHGQDVFKAFIYPNFTDYRTEWNSLSPDWIENSEGMSLDECRKRCEDDGRCLQYTHAAGGCWLGQYAMLGQPWGNVSSGWMMERIDHWMEELDHCEDWNVGWFLRNT